MSTRREFLTTIPAICFPITQADAAQADRIDQLASELVFELERRHGGTWVATRDAKHEFVMLCRR